ncbi:MAG TPA: hypothetical protein VNN10_01495 [Dehalococcoidia bacterium]|nr:hypothetical protein [Dehalococcoidia bacterium]
MQQSPTLRVSISPESERIAPGEKAVFSVTIVNLGQQAQSQEIEVLGLPGAWFSVDFDSSRLAFEGEQRTASLVVSVPPDGEPGSYPFRVEVLAGEDSSVAEASLEVVAEGAAGDAGTSSPPAAAPREAPPVISLSPALVVWRGEGQNMERLTLSVGNPGDADAVYAVQVTGLDQAWYNLAPVLRVPAGQILETEMRLQPPATARQGDYPFRVTVAAERRPEVASTASGWLSISKRQGAAAPAPAPTPERVVFTPPPQTEPLPELSLAPRTTFRFGPADVSENAILTIQNRGKVAERYQLSVSGIPEDWIGFATSEVRLEPGASTQVPLRITPRTGADWPAGDYEFRVRAAPVASPGLYAEVGGLISISGVASFDARLAPVQAEGGTATYTLTAVNTGDLPLSLTLEAADPEKMCRFKYDPPRDLSPGQQAVVRLKAGARRNGIIGSRETFDFRVRVLPSGQPPSAAKLLDARFVHKPLLGYRSLFLVFFAALIVGLVALVLKFASPVVADAATWIGCQLDGSYRLSADSLSIRKPECGGRQRADDLLDWQRSRPASRVAPGVGFPVPAALPPSPKMTPWGEAT